MTKFFGSVGRVIKVPTQGSASERWCHNSFAVRCCMWRYSDEARNISIPAYGKLGGLGRLEVATSSLRISFRLARGSRCDRAGFRARRDSGVSWKLLGRRPLNSSASSPSHTRLPGVARVAVRVHGPVAMQKLVPTTEWQMRQSCCNALYKPFRQYTGRWRLRRLNFSIEW